MPVMAPASVVHRHRHHRQLDAFEETPPCREDNLNGLLYVDCSDRGLSELPESMNFDVSVL